MKDVDVIVFGKRSQEFFELSPFYFCTFTIGGKKWRTLIHYWVASYFKNNMYLMELIRNQDTPHKAIMMGEHHGLYDMNQINPKDIIYAIQERFNQNDGIKSILLSTGYYYLKYDGTGFMANDNRYGRILMKMREIYEND